MSSKHAQDGLGPNWLSIANQFGESSWFFAIGVYALLIARWGFDFGTGDQSEIMPYLLYLQDNSLFQNDISLAWLRESAFNIRTFTAYLLYPFGEHHLLAVQCWHLVSTILLVVGIEYMGKALGFKQWSVRIGMLLCLIPFYNNALGDVDLYYPAFQASLIAKALAVWVLYFLWHRKWWIAASLSVVLLVAHVLVGVQVLLLALGIALLKATNHWKLLIGFAVLATLGILLLPNDIQYYAINVFYRHPNHFLIDHYPWFNVLLIGGCCALIIKHGRKQRLLAYAVPVFLVPFTFYVIGLEYAQHAVVAMTQWYKLSIWIKLAGCIIFVEYMIDREINWHRSTTLIFVAFALFCYGVRDHLSFEVSRQTKLADYYSFLHEVRDFTPIDAVLLHPKHMSGVTYHTRRASYVNWKAIPKQNSGLKLWMQRAVEVYGIDGQAPFSLVASSPASALRAKGIDYIITEELVLDNKILILHHKQWRLYGL